MFARHREGITSTCGTITLGGVENTDGIRGFIASGHVVVRRSQREDGTWADDYSITDIVTGHSGNDEGDIKYFLGKVYQMPSFSMEGDRRFFTVDAAFVAYPRPQTPGCSLTWSSDSESFCLDEDSDGEQIERLVPLTVRGANGATHRVVGTQAVTEGLELQTLGASSAVPVRSVAEGDKILTGVEDTEGLLYVYEHYASLTTDQDTIGGDSGAPVYTLPDADGNVWIVGVHTGGIFDRNEITFSPWEAVEDAFDLVPIGAPAPDSPAEEDEEELAGLFSLFD